MSDPYITSPRILHVDDDEKILRDVAEFLQDEEIAGWGRPTVVSVPVFDDALELLDQQRFDLVILDVRLGEHENADLPVPDEAGVATLEQIRQRRFVPIVFWTGLPKTVEHLEDSLVSVREKTSGLKALLKAVRDQFATRLPLVNRALFRLVEEQQRRYMWDFVAKNWNGLDSGDDQTALAYLLARRLGQSLTTPALQQLAAELGDTSGLFPAAETIHPVEMYIQPSLPGKLQAGDLLREPHENGDRWSMILTPSCDLEWDKAEMVLLASGGSIETHPRVIAWRADEGSAKQKKKARDELHELLRQATGGQLDRWLYLPAAIAVPDLLIDMQQLRAVSPDEAATMDRVASLDSPFAESAVNRFNRYFGRIGTPDLDPEAIVKRLTQTPPDSD